MALFSLRAQYSLTAVITRDSVPQSYRGN